ncbi:iron-sulfur cluster assembly protein [Halegenticoccus soli]|uniref:iron-sulfur cluster assembly protein n=1 Tax=Halegenticoccus soli TaxID=1985678 RepID=UPI000C6E96B8|nr:iron-sulfur cluster assembly protein [Halegenticoccus soli]
MAGSNPADAGGDATPADADETATPADAAPPTREAVLGRLDRVTDPELDRSLVELGYVDEIEIDPPRVSVAFRLPTAWCSPAFAWMMATDAREEIEALDGVASATVELRDHVHETEINDGVNRGLPFEEVFPDADGGVEAVRRELDEKARLARQYRAVSTLLEAGLSPEQIVRLAPADVEFDGAPDSPPPITGDEAGVGRDDGASTERDGETEAGRDDGTTDDRDGGTATVYVRGGTVGVAFSASSIREYLEKAEALGLVSGADDDRPLFRTPDGNPIPADEFDMVRRRARLAHVNMDGQGGVCAYLHEARYGDRGVDASNAPESA